LPDLAQTLPPLRGGKSAPSGCSGSLARSPGMEPEIRITLDTRLTGLRGRCAQVASTGTGGVGRGSEKKWRPESQASGLRRQSQCLLRSLTTESISCVASEGRVTIIADEECGGQMIWRREGMCNRCGRANPPSAVLSLSVGARNEMSNEGMENKKHRVPL